MPIPLFNQLEVETSSTCNRTCSGCLRNSLPQREEAAPWFTQNLMPLEMFSKALDETLIVNPQAHVCMQHYNEPLQDPRIASLGRLAKSKGFRHVFLCTNADLMTEALAAELDVSFDRLRIALYMDDPVKKERERWLRQLFKNATLEFTGGIHIPTHHNPNFDVEGLAEQHKELPCSEPIYRMILNHQGEMLLCCDDMTGHFDLGNIRDHTIQELWYSEKHQRIIEDLRWVGGRLKYPWCATCPRG